MSEKGGWQVQKKRWLSRTHVYGGGSEPAFEWVPVEGFPIAPTREEALRAFMESLNPELKGTPHAFLQSHWQTPMVLNNFRLVRVPS